MTYHLVLSRKLDMDAVRREVAAGARPQHVLVELADRMGMQVHAPANDAASMGDRARSKLCGTPALWRFTRDIAARMHDGDVALCNGEDIGLPLAVAAGPKVRVAAFVHNLDRPRMKVALRLMGWGRHIARWITPCEHQADFLRRLGFPAPRIETLLDQTDLAFFHPPTAPAEKPRPVIASVGLEGRDYRTLAAATHDLDADVRISGFSADAKAMANAFPETLPANMTRRFYEWPDLAALYRHADVVVVSLFHRTYAAGVTTFLEGMASGKPIVITETPGMRRYIEEARHVGVEIATVAVGDAAAMRAAITKLLADAPRAAAIGRAGRAFIEHRHNPSQWLVDVERALRSLAPATTPASPLVTA